jgi:hypothetical protein
VSIKPEHVPTEEDFRRLRIERKDDLFVLPSMTSKKWLLRRRASGKTIGRFDSHEDAIEAARSLAAKSATIPDIFTYDKSGRINRLPSARKPRKHRNGTSADIV